MVRDDDDNGLGLAYEKLTHGYWRNYIRTTVLSMPGERWACVILLFFLINNVLPGIFCFAG